MKNKYLVWLITILLLIGLFGCENSSCNGKKAEDYKRNHPSATHINTFLRDLSPDNRTLLFQYGSPYWSKIGTYDITTGKIIVFNDDGNNKMNDAPSFSRDGKKIVFIKSREHGYGRNIYTMNADGSNIRQITKNPEMKSDNIIYAHAPSFSPDGERIIFLRSHKTRERAYPLQGGMHADWDIYEVDIDTGIEKRLTNYNFYEASWPFYMADGKRFIFSGKGPYNPTGDGPKDFMEYETKYQKNFILIMDGKGSKLKPAFINGSHSARPHVSDNDEILFTSRTNEIDRLASEQETQDLFLNENGEIKRLTKLVSYVDWARISRDGHFIIFAKKTNKKSSDYSEWIMKSDGTGLNEIKIPADKLKK